MVKEYKKDDLTIVWDNTKCTHATFCAKGLPEVFKPKEKPWIQTENASKEAVEQQVLKCPLGALSVKG